MYNNIKHIIKKIGIDKKYICKNKKKSNKN